MFIPLNLFTMDPAAPDGAPPRRISVYKHICIYHTAPAVPRKGPKPRSPHKITWFNDFQVRV